MSDNVISWLFRIVLACLAFAAVFFGLPWLLKLGDLVWPQIVIFLIACLAALIVLSHYYWGRTRV